MNIFSKLKHKIVFFPPHLNESTRLGFFACFYCYYHFYCYGYCPTLPGLLPFDVFELLSKRLGTGDSTQKRIKYFA